MSSTESSSDASSIMSDNEYLSESEEMFETQREVKERAEAVVSDMSHICLPQSRAMNPTHMARLHGWMIPLLTMNGELNMSKMLGKEKFYSKIC